MQNAVIQIPSGSYASTDVLSVRLVIANVRFAPFLPKFGDPAVQIENGSVDVFVETADGQSFENTFAIDGLMSAALFEANRWLGSLIEAELNLSHALFQRVETQLEDNLE